MRAGYKSEQHADSCGGPVGCNFRWQGWVPQMQAWGAALHGMVQVHEGRGCQCQCGHGVGAGVTARCQCEQCKLLWWQHGGGGQAVAVVCGRASERRRHVCASEQVVAVACGQWRASECGSSAWAGVEQASSGSGREWRVGSAA
jgi:hypothetical protein